MLYRLAANQFLSIIKGNTNAKSTNFLPPTLLYDTAVKHVL